MMYLPPTSKNVEAVNSIGSIDLTASTSFDLGIRITP